MRRYSRPPSTAAVAALPTVLPVALPAALRLRPRAVAVVVAAVGVLLVAAFRRRVAGLAVRDVLTTAAVPVAVVPLALDGLAARGLRSPRASDSHCSARRRAVSSSGASTW